MFDGKPSEGTSALLLDLKTNSKISMIRSVLVEKDCLNTAKMFEFMIKKTHDPEERYSKAVKFFASEYYNTPENFDGSFTATFPFDSNLINKVLKNKKCIVEFFEAKGHSNWNHIYYCVLPGCSPRPSKKDTQYFSLPIKGF